MNQPQLLYLPELVFLTCRIQMVRLDNINSFTETDFFFCIYVGIPENIMSLYRILMNGLPGLLKKGGYFIYSF